MLEITGDIWGQKCDWLCITTNGIIKSNGHAVMGKGIALQAAQRFPNIDLLLAQSIKVRGNVVSALLKAPDGRIIISFPTKNNWRSPSDIELIRKSANQLKKNFDKMAIKPIVLLPRPGCSNGQLEWAEVKEILTPILVDKEFLIINK